MEKQLIDIAFELARAKYSKKPFTFNQLWKELIKKAKLDADEQKQVGYVYTCMLQDVRFIFVGNDQWKIREFLTLEEQQQYSNALYDFMKENVTKKTKDEDYGNDFNYDQDEEDEYKSHTTESLDDEENEEDEIDNESETSESDDEDEEYEEENENDKQEKDEK